MPVVRGTEQRSHILISDKLALAFTELLDEGRVSQNEYDALIALHREWTGPVENDDPQNLLTPFQRWGVKGHEVELPQSPAPSPPPLPPLPPQHMIDELIRVWNTG